MLTLSRNNFLTTLVWIYFFPLRISIITTTSSTNNYTYFTYACLVSQEDCKLHESRDCFSLHHVLNIIKFNKRNYHADWQCASQSQSNQLCANPTGNIKCIFLPSVVWPPGSVTSSKWLMLTALNRSHPLFSETGRFMSVTTFVKQTREVRTLALGIWVLQ